MNHEETRKTIAEIRSLGHLPSDWNGYRADPIDPAVIQTAATHVERYSGLIDSPPEVVPMTDGRLQLEWVAGDRELELEFTSPKTIRYLAWCEGYDPDEDEYSVDDDYQSRRSFDWLFGRLGQDQ